MTPRYIKQRDKFRCGPVAIMNALKWAGKKFSYNTLRDSLTKACKCISPHGTKHKAFDAALRKAGKKLYSVRRVYHPTLAEIESHLHNEGAIILSCRYDDDDEQHRHFHLLVGISPLGGYFYTVNDSLESPVLFPMEREVFKREYLRFLGIDSHYKGWFLEKV